VGRRSSSFPNTKKSARRRATCEPHGRGGREKNSLSRGERRCHWLPSRRARHGSPHEARASKERTCASHQQHMGARRVRTVIPARPGKPRGKAKVEGGVRIAQRWILACFGHCTFFSLDALDEARFRRSTAFKKIRKPIKKRRSGPLPPRSVLDFLCPKPGNPRQPSRRGRARRYAASCDRRDGEECDESRAHPPTVVDRTGVLRPRCSQPSFPRSRTLARCASASSSTNGPSCESGTCSSWPSPWPTSLANRRRDSTRRKMLRSWIDGRPRSWTSLLTLASSKRRKSKIDANAKADVARSSRFLRQQRPDQPRPSSAYESVLQDMGSSGTMPATTAGSFATNTI
jgi:hypothetical protein